MVLVLNSPTPDLLFMFSVKQPELAFNVDWSWWLQIDMALVLLNNLCYKIAYRMKNKGRWHKWPWKFKVSPVYKWALWAASGL